MSCSKEQTRLSVNLFGRLLSLDSPTGLNASRRIWNGSTRIRSAACFDDCVESIALDPDCNVIERNARRAQRTFRLTTSKMAELKVSGYCL